MRDPFILHIETATSICSVALSEGENLLILKESADERSHAKLLTKFIKECFLETKREISQLDAVNVSKGPGSYTGLRIGVSTTKGIAYAHNIPVIATGTLNVLVLAALKNREISAGINQNKKGVLLCPMLDARRMEVFTAFFNPDSTPFREVSADIIETDSYADLLQSHRIFFFGDGSEKCKGILQHPNAQFIDNITPSAGHMVSPGLDAYKIKAFENVAYFEPFYLKEFIATIPKKKVL